LSTARESLVAARTQLVNSIRGWLRTQGRAVRAATAESFAKKLHQIQAQLPEYINAQRVVVDALNEQIATTDRMVRAAAKQNSVTRRMMTVPGVGPVTAVRVFAALDEVERFEGAHKVQAYLGLTPGEHSSSERQRRTGITKAGPTEVRRVLVQAAWSARQAKGSHPMVDWARHIELRRGKFIATVALARKIAGVLYAIWRDETTYDATRAARSMEPRALTEVAFG
jgi:transposase